MYKTSMSSSSLLGEPFVNKIKTNPNLAEDFVTETINAETSRSSVMSFYVFYENLAYTESIETVNRVSFLSFISTSGGIISLFTGLSVLSFFELIEILMEYYYIRNIQLNAESTVSSS